MRDAWILCERTLPGHREQLAHGVLRKTLKLWIAELWRKRIGLRAEDLRVVWCAAGWIGAIGACERDEPRDLLWGECLLQPQIAAARCHTERLKRRRVGIW